MTLQHGGHRVWLLVYGGACLLAAALALTLQLFGTYEGGPTVAAFGLAFGIPCFIARRARIEVDSDGLTVINPFARRRLSWNEVADVRVGNVRGVAYPIEVVAAGGHTIRSFGVMEVRLGPGPSDALRRIAADLAQRRTRG